VGRFRDVWYISALAGLCLIVVVAVALSMTAASNEPHAEARSAATATAAPAATPAPAPSPDPVTLDFARGLDLGKIRDAMTLYRQRHGAFPTTSGQLTELCNDSSDAGCVLSEVWPGLPFGDGASDYWVSSDGAAYTLVAVAALPQPDTSSCPAQLPAELAGRLLMCLHPGE